MKNHVILQIVGETAYRAPATVIADWTASGAHYHLAVYVHDTVGRTWAPCGDHWTIWEDCEARNSL